jgi:hypothetical protein
MLDEWEIIDIAHNIMEGVMEDFNDNYEVYSDTDTGSIIHAVSIGSVLDLMPSKKSFFSPALCHKCGGKGCDFCGHTGSREAYEDHMLIAEMSDIAHKNGYTLSNNYGDPCELYLEKIELQFGSASEATGENV